MMFHLELIEPVSVDHIDDVEEDVASEAGKDEGLPGELIREWTGKESYKDGGEALQSTVYSLGGKI